MKMLLIIGCKDQRRWYSSKVGELVPFFGDAGGEYKSAEDAGYINFVQYDDAVIVEVS